MNPEREIRIKRNADGGYCLFVDGKEFSCIDFQELRRRLFSITTGSADMNLNAAEVVDGAE